MVFKIEGNTKEEKDWLKRIASWPDMSLFNSFRILIGILLSPSLLPWFKNDIMLETSVLSVGAIKIYSILTALGNRVFQIVVRGGEGKFLPPVGGSEILLGGIFLLGTGNLRSDFDDSNLFKS